MWYTATSAGGTSFSQARAYCRVIVASPLATALKRQTSAPPAPGSFRAGGDVAVVHERHHLPVRGLRQAPLEARRHVRRQPEGEDLSWPNGPGGGVLGAEARRQQEDGQDGGGGWIASDAPQGPVPRRFTRVSRLPVSVPASYMQVSTIRRSRKSPMPPAGWAESASPS